MFTLISLYNMYFHSFLTSNPEQSPELHSASNMLGEAYHRDINQSTEKKKYIIDAIREVMPVFESRAIRSKIKTARYSTAHGELRGSYKVFLRA